jgi:hypothetical protein
MIVDDSHGYCRVDDASLGDERGRSAWEPYYVEQVRHETEVSVRATLALYARGEYSKTLDVGSRLMASEKGSLLREVLEALCRSAMHLNDLGLANKYLTQLDNEFKSVEDPSRLLLGILVRDRMADHESCLKDCQEYLSIRPGDIRIVRKAIQSCQLLGLTDMANRYSAIADTIDRCYQRKCD